MTEPETPIEGLTDKERREIYDAVRALRPSVVSFDPVRDAADMVVTLIDTVLRSKIREERETAKKQIAEAIARETAKRRVLTDTHRLHLTAAAIRGLTSDASILSATRLEIGAMAAEIADRAIARLAEIEEAAR